MNMKKNSFSLRFVLLFMLALLFQGIAMAQTKKVSGIVKDATGEPLIGVSVQVKGTSVGTLTDLNGSYSLDAPEGANSLVFTYIGMNTKEETIIGEALNTTLEDSSKALEEVVVVGYGTAKKSDLTGAISSVNSGKITEAGRTNALGSIQGSIPGVNISQSSSRAGAIQNIIIRGQNSVSGNTAPLYVVDGIITSSIDFLNPQDIEKIDVLKDASSTAIYGSRGSNGVIIVQTKSGASVQEKAKTQISYDGYYGVSQKARMPKFMDTQDWMKYRMLNYQYTRDDNQDGVLEFYNNDLNQVWMGGTKYQDLGAGAGFQPVYNDGTFGGSQWLLNRYLNNENTDWVDLVTRTGYQQNHYLDISGSTKDVAYVIGLGYQNEKGIFVKDDYSRYNLKGSVTAKLNSKWSAGFSFNTAYSDQEMGSDNAMLSAFRMSPITDAYDENGVLDPKTNDLEGNIIVIPGKTTDTTTVQNGISGRNKVYNNSIGGSGFTSSINPLIDLESTSNNKTQLNALASTYLQFNPMKDLSFKSTFSPSVINYRHGLYKSSQAEGNYDNPFTPASEQYAIANVDNYRYMNFTLDNQVNYKFSLKNLHKFDVMALHSVYSENSELYTINSKGYNYDFDWYNLGAASNTAATTLNSVYQESAMVSGALRINYSYKGKYLFTASYRADGSSRLAENHKWSSFPSAAIAWRMSDEKFMLPTRKIVSNLKLRASLGYTGNNNISPFQTQYLANNTSYYNFGGTNAKGMGVGSLTESTLTWERTREIDLGMDLGFFNSRLELTLDIYDRLSDGLLQNRTLPYETGAGSVIDNLGSVSNKGIELAINSTIIDKKDFTWSANISFAANQNEIVSLFDNETAGYTFINSNTQKWIVGENINSIYGYVFDGVWTANEIQTAIANKDPRAVDANGLVIAREGQAKVKDYDGNGIDPNDRRVQGHSDPSWTAGLGTTITYKGFDLSANIYTAQGMTVFSPFMEEFTNYNDRGRQKLDMDYYVPAGATLMGADGYFYTNPTAINNQDRPMPYTSNGNNNNCGTYWHNGKEVANDMPGAWVDASYIKVRNITLGYTMPKKWMKPLQIQSLRLYTTVLNPFVFTDYLGFDPEWAGASMGRDNGPSTITYQFGANLKF